MAHFLEGKYFLRIVDDEDGGCSSQHGRILASDRGYLLIQYGIWENGLPLDRPAHGRRIAPILSFCDEYCYILDSFQEVLEALAYFEDREPDEFSSKWEAKMNDS